MHIIIVSGNKIFLWLYKSCAVNYNNLGKYIKLLARAFKNREKILLDAGKI